MWYKNEAARKKIMEAREKAALEAKQPTERWPGIAPPTTRGRA